MLDTQLSIRTSSNRLIENLTHRPVTSPSPPHPPFLLSPSTSRLGLLFIGNVDLGGLHRVFPILFVGHGVTHEYVENFGHLTDLGQYGLSQTDVRNNAEKIADVQFAAE